MLNINKVLDKTTILLRGLSGILLSIMLIITFLQVILRYIFKSPIMWAEEITLVMLIWFGYFTISIAVWEEEHMALEVFYQMFNGTTRKFLDIIRYLLMIGFSSLMFYYGLKLVINAQGKFLPASKISRTILYMPLSVGGILMVVYSIAHLIKRLTASQEKEVR